MTGPDPRPPPDPEIVASAFRQSPTITVVLDGPQLQIVAWSSTGERFLKPILGDIGASVWGVDWIEGTGVYESLRSVLDTGEPFTARGWRLALPDDSGAVREVYLDFTCTPWRRPDGSIRGIIGVAADVSDTYWEQRAVEAKAATWQQRFEVSRDAMIAMQAALLPATVPVLPGLQIAARYVLADADTAAGGDWFSAYPTNDGRVALVVGDVVGHGVVASATMGQLRAVIKERLRSGAPLSAALQALDSYAQIVPDADATTVCAALMDPSTGELEYCTAGHPPPLLVHNGSWRYLEHTGAGPLGSGRPFTTMRTTIPPDALLLLYSDGLIERPGIERTASTTEIARVASNARAGRPIMPTVSSHVADRVCELSLELLTRTTGIADDITVLALQRIDPVTDLTARLSASPEVATVAVNLIESWLEAVGACETDRLHLRHAVLEVVANSMEHGFADARQDGVIEVSGHLGSTGEAVIELADNGHWKEPDTSPGDPDGGQLRGFGLPLARQLLDGLAVRHSGSGTQVRITHRLNRPAPIVTTAGPHRVEPELASLSDELELTSDQQHPDTLMVRGPLLTTTAERLRTRLDLASRAGTRSLTLNLDDVTHLTSAAVRVLQQAQRSARRQEQQLTLTARPGSIAHDVLRLLSVPVDPDDEPRN